MDDKKTAHKGHQAFLIALWWLAAYPHTSSSSSRASSSSGSTPRTSLPPAVLSRQMGGSHRRTRSADNVNSLLTDFTMMFQSFTEGELQHVVGSLLDRKRRKSRRQGDSQARRTKRARRPKPCSVRELEMTVSELGLGYDSPETVNLQYCGKCSSSRMSPEARLRSRGRPGIEETAARCLSSRRLRRKMAGMEDAAVTLEDSNNCSEQVVLVLLSSSGLSRDSFTQCF
ncbi:neurturin-like [Platichthys flesus]|uniref:neurturin-like n=1 Tax=Platichthys flesus TaxID=8260 RepID=UPI002DBCF960|nr:neurturin-like [Platichthys flesus]